MQQVKSSLVLPRDLREAFLRSIAGGNDIWVEERLLELDGTKETRLETDEQGYLGRLKELSSLDYRLIGNGKAKLKFEGLQTVTSSFIHRQPFVTGGARDNADCGLNLHILDQAWQTLNLGEVPDRLIEQLVRGYRIIGYAWPYGFALFVSIVNFADDEQPTPYKLRRVGNTLQANLRGGMEDYQQYVPELKISLEQWEHVFLGLSLELAEQVVQSLVPVLGDR